MNSKKIMMNNSGILCINKEEGYTSRDIVNIVCKLLKTKKIGHTGTLDPLATGVLVLGVNEGTKLVELITAYNKEYIARVRLGMSTDTLDITGNTLSTCDVSNITDKKIDEVVSSFEKTYEQEVPIYSAVKIKGKKLLEYARNNEEIELPKREVTIYSIERISDVIRLDNFIEFDIKCRVSKGTYIRSLTRDIGNCLGTKSTMVSLKRTRQGDFSIKDCYSISDIENNNYKLISINDALKNYKRVVLDEKTYKKVINGALIDNIYNSSEVLFVDSESNVVALYKVYEKNNKLMKPWKMFKTIAN